MSVKTQTKVDKERIKQAKREGWIDNLTYSVAVISVVEGIKTRVIQKAARDGRLKGKQISPGGKWRFTGAKIKKWLVGE